MIVNRDRLDHLDRNASSILWLRLSVRLPECCIDGTFTSDI